jgi:hypothetical protein
LTVIFLLLRGTAVSAAAVAAPPLPAPDHANGEVTLDIPLGKASAGADGEAGTFRVTLRFGAAVSNNVQFALGRDRDPADGKLSASETGFAAGWDRGRFVLRPRGLAEIFEVPDDREPDGGAPGPVTLVFQVRRTSAGGLADTAFTVNGRPLAFPVPPSPAPEWLAPPWDILRVTSRGADSPDAEVSVKTFKQGVSVILR